MSLTVVIIAYPWQPLVIPPSAVLNACWPNGTPRSLRPDIAPETSSLVAREALAAATPVVALDSPALRELIEDRVTGFLVQDHRDLAAAITMAVELDCNRCKAAALDRCDVIQTAQAT